MIRPATLSDIPEMLAMGERFITKAWEPRGIPYDEESCTELLTGLMGNGILLVAEDGRGMIGVVVHPWHFNKHAITATELFWWCEPGCKAGKALKAEAERLAREAGATTINMACEHHMRSPALERLYRMDGYDPSEHIFIKDIG